MAWKIGTQNWPAELGPPSESQFSWEADFPWERSIFSRKPISRVRPLFCRRPISHGMPIFHLLQDLDSFTNRKIGPNNWTAKLAGRIGPTIGKPIFPGKPISLGRPIFSRRPISPGRPIFSRRPIFPGRPIFLAPLISVMNTEAPEKKEADFFWPCQRTL